MLAQVQQDRYELAQYAPHAYVFTTERGNTYIIRFIRYWQEDVVELYVQEELEVYEIYFEVMEIKDKGYDRRIQFTIIGAIVDFLAEDDRVGFFDIKREDGRGLELLRVYRIWLKMYEKNRKEKSIMLNRIVSIPDQFDSHIACLVHPNNQCFKQQDVNQLMDRVLKEIFPRAALQPF